MKKVIVAILAVAVIGVSGYAILSRTKLGRPKVSDDSKHWAMLSMAGFYRCPSCKKRVKLTKDQLASLKPPELTCPRCKKPVDIVEVMTGKPRTSTAGTTPTP